MSYDFWSNGYWGQRFFPEGYFGVDTVVPPGGVVATLTVQEANDLLNAIGQLTDTASAIVQEANDLLSATGQLTDTASTVVQEANDLLASTGQLSIAGSLMAVEAPDLLSATNSAAIAFLQLIEQNDSLSSRGTNSDLSSYFVTGFDITLMATLARMPTQTLFYDYSHTEEYFIRDNSTNDLFKVPPIIASRWIRQQGCRILYNPFRRLV